jgi:hypothetical protein
MRRCGAAAVLACAGYALPERERKIVFQFLVPCHCARRVKLTARPNGPARRIPDRSAICLRSRCLCGRTHATITNVRRLCEDGCIRSRKLEPAYFSGLVFGHTILETPKRGSLTNLLFIRAVGVQLSARLLYAGNEVYSSVRSRVLDRVADHL